MDVEAGGEAESGEIMSYRAAVLATVGSFAFMSFWLWSVGLPLWVAVSTGVAFLIACLAAWTAFRAWPSDGDDPEGGS